MLCSLKAYHILLCGTRTIQEGQVHRILFPAVSFQHNTNDVCGIDRAIASYEAVLVVRKLDDITNTPVDNPLEDLKICYAEAIELEAVCAVCCTDPFLPNRNRTASLQTIRHFLLTNNVVEELRQPLIYFIHSPRVRTNVQNKTF